MYLDLALACFVQPSLSRFNATSAGADTVCSTLALWRICLFLHWGTCRCPDLALHFNWNFVL